MNNPGSVSEWLALAERHRSGAQKLFAAGDYDLAWFLAGMAAECALKAAIMHVERFNAWPSPSARPDLYVHDLTALIRKAGIDVAALIGDPIYARLATIRMWKRSEGYNPKTMPRKVASDMVEAVCGAEGVIGWIETQFRLI